MIGVAIRSDCITLLVPAHFHVEMRYEPVSFLLSRPERFHCINVSPFSASMRSTSAAFTTLIALPRVYAALKDAP